MFSPESEDGPACGIYHLWNNGLYPMTAGVQSYTGQRQQTCSSFVTGIYTMSSQGSDTAFIPGFNLCWCIHKAGLECAKGTHHNLPPIDIIARFKRTLWGGRFLQEQTAIVASTLCVCWLKLSEYHSFNFPTVGHRLCCRANKLSPAQTGFLQMLIQIRCQGSLSHFSWGITRFFALTYQVILPKVISWGSGITATLGLSVLWITCLSCVNAWRGMISFLLLKYTLTHI